MLKRLPALRTVVVCAVTAALAAGTLAGAGGAAADSDFVPTVWDLSFSPGNSWAVSGGAWGTADGTAVYAFSKQALTDASWAGGGLPAGLTASVADTSCKAYAGAPGIYTCPVTQNNPLDSPTVVAAASAANHTTAYVGAAYAPRGSSLATAIKAAEMAGTTSTPDIQTAAVIKVLTADQVAKSTVQLTTVDVPLSSSTVHTVHVHAADPGYLAVSFGPTSDERRMDTEELDVQVTSVDGGPAGACDHTTDSFASSQDAARCHLPAGDHTITYTLKSGPKVAAWKVVGNARFEVVNYGVGNPESTSTFKVLSPYPVSERYRLFARDAKGWVWSYGGTGDATAPFGMRDPMDDSWSQYTGVTALSGVTVHGTGDVVARDKSGVLWYYRGSGALFEGVFKPRAKVGGGWNTYGPIVGAGDVTGDGKADLLGRDAAGVLWLYKGTASTSAPFAARTQIGGGWNTYKSLTAAGDLTGDGKADLLATDGSGALWLYKGTGNAAAPYAARTKVGTGWQIYSALVGQRDLNGDGRNDIVGRDSAGVLWLYKGTGNATAPYAARTKIGGGWNAFNLLF